MKLSSLAFIIPSYNESQNLFSLVSRIRGIYTKSQIIIVDDSNAEEKIKIKKLLTRFSRDKNLTYVPRKKKLGRGNAVFAGFKLALKNKKITHVFEMDADLSHNPVEAEKFISKIKKSNHDLIIGSRYLTESKIIKWAKWRVIMSKVINKFLNILLNLHLTDYTNGYRLYNRKAVEFLCSINLQSNGFILLSETAYKLNRNGFKISEVPTTFAERKFGNSSMGNRELLSSLVHILLIRFLDIKILKKLSAHKIQILCLCFLILFTLILRLWNLNKMGRTWDEPAYVEGGYTMTELMRMGDFNNPYYLSTFDHPPMARYLYGIASHLDLEGFEKNGEPIFRYDYTNARLVSVLFSVLSVLLVALFGWKYISPFVGITAGIILAMLPTFLGYSQIATLESLVIFFFTLSVFLFINLLHKHSLKNIFLTGIFTGLALGVKQTNIFIFPLFVFIYFIWYLSKNKKDKPNIIRSIFIPLFLILIISAITFTLFWPTALFDLNSAVEIEKTMWFSSNVKLPPPEVFYGRLMLVPIVYYPVYFAITTPFLVIILFLVGMKVIDIRKKIVLYAVLIWFILPFFQSFYPLKQHGLRYIIQVYAPLALIAAMGLEYIVNKIGGNLKIKSFALLFLIIYFFVILSRITPYYLDYFNILTGGVNGVYESKLFQIGSWGQGLKEAGVYLKENGPKNSRIGLAISPIHSFPKYNHYNEELYNEKKEYDYVVVNYFHVLREGFDDRGIKRKYKLIHQVFADKAPLVDIYQRK